jgi:chitinase
VESAVDFVRRHDLDGFDVDWEYPGPARLGNVNRPEDKQNFTRAHGELRPALDKEGARAAAATPHLRRRRRSDFLEHTEMDVCRPPWTT